MKVGGIYKICGKRGKFKIFVEIGGEFLYASLA